MQRRGGTFHCSAKGLTEESGYRSDGDGVDLSPSTIDSIRTAHTETEVAVFRQTQERWWSLRVRYDAGEVTPQQFLRELRDLADDAHPAITRPLSRLAAVAEEQKGAGGATVACETPPIDQHGIVGEGCKKATLAPDLQSAIEDQPPRAII
jgi:hypothetical protein